jgi:hypothetical protein
MGGQGTEVSGEATLGLDAMLLGLAFGWESPPIVRIHTTTSTNAIAAMTTDHLRNSTGAGDRWLRREGSVTTAKSHRSPLADRGKAFWRRD